MTGDVHVAGLQLVVSPAANAGSALSITVMSTAQSIVAFSVVLPLMAYLLVNALKAVSS
jgi:hypothetical protein